MIRKPLLMMLLFAVFAISCGWFETDAEPQPRLSMFVGVDISGSFVKGDYFDDALNFLSYYIYCHLHALDDLKEPNVLFVGAIGGAREGEPKTFFPIQTFENKSIEEIRTQLKEIFPKEGINPYTDYNAFFEQVATTVRNRNLLLRPISIVMLSDGVPDVESSQAADYESIDLSPLEKLARSITVRLLYTDAATAKKWQTLVSRRRVKMWTQDAKVMTSWNDETIFVPNQPIEEQTRFFEWLKDNVDFGVRSAFLR
ncbi:MAG: hypothetical protein U5R06_14375 [candidate division KSB1 bacterium]|nr:hypothetical protein [candidate division KSB1 bacterium]